VCAATVPILYKVIIFKTQRERNGRLVLYVTLAIHFENKYSTGNPKWVYTIVSIINYNIIIITYRVDII